METGRWHQVLQTRRRALSSGLLLSHVLTHANKSTKIKLLVALKLSTFPNGPSPDPAQCPQGPEQHPRAAGNVALEELGAMPPRFLAAGRSTMHANGLGNGIWQLKVDQNHKNELL